MSKFPLYFVWQGVCWQIGVVTTTRKEGAREYQVRVGIKVISEEG
jgi:hypothetical protein